MAHDARPDEPHPALELQSLYQAHARSVRRFLGDLLHDDAAADEGTQETFVRAHGRLSTLRATDKALSWLLGIARNVFYEELRRRRRHLRSVDVDDERNESAELAAPAPSPEGVLMGQEADTQLEAALAELGEDRRAALLMRIDHELDYEEIAAAMSWPLSKVKNEIHRARLTLRARLGSYVGGR